MATALDEINLLANPIPPFYVFSQQAVQDTAHLLLAEHKKAARRICESLKPIQLNRENLKSNFERFFGSLNQNHGIYPGHRLGFDATEPQITKGIASFLDPVTHGKKGEARLKAFLIALLNYSSKNRLLVSSLNETNARSFIVESEKFVPKANRRIDLFIAWNPIDSHKYEYGVLIEAKFGHKVTAGQLLTYRQYAKAVFENIDNSALILLTLNGKRSKKNKDWQAVQWLTFMSRWERILDDTDIDFAQFRRFIWKKLGS
ncbi:hypothetical protein A1507_13035 [Methylomonas koyamae]|uniref:Uncharacterized protein n=1 Tax=Methylomonas koyamae TaxID=702114 RepID=A0A177NCW2_9GAMM|nr:PD-(D/E)XK nuclease family protein [Methylomonas koyamae]OAI15745.1 hypothetical protein A1507_13035 [Methylomonas koyamae]BBL60824.1 hypothetical protein MKFW12EY_44370 [Methylomonas koyamae]